MAANRERMKGKASHHQDSGKELEKWTPEQARRNLETWKESGLGMTEFCRRTGISYHRMYWWKRHHGDWLGQDDQETTTDGGIRWVQARIGCLEPDPAPEVSIQLRSGDRIEIYDSHRTDADWLRQISLGLLM